MQHSSGDSFDVRVVGGGPSGSTTAALLARRGWRVLQVEMAYHPRLHIAPPLALQVRRDRFDAMLFDHARHCAVDTRDGVRVDQVEFEAEGVSARLDGEGGGRAVRARHLIDASGRDTWLGNALGLKRAGRRQAVAATALGARQDPA